MSRTFSLLNEKPSRSLSEFEFLQNPKDKNSHLGVGSFATVKLAREKKNNQLIALKMVNLEISKCKAADLHNLKTEVYIHKKIDHPNIIKYLGYTQESSCIYIALDYAEKGNLYSYIHKKNSSLSSEEIFQFFHQTCLAIQYLHRHDVMHRDIKPENLLLDQDLNIKLCDFGWASERIKDKRTTFCGTYEYMAPEIIHKRPYDYRIDIWSLGILLYELIHKEAPYKGRSLSEIWNSLSKGVNYSPSIDPHAKDLIQNILRLNPSDRLSISQILSHPWIKKHLMTECILTDNNTTERPMTSVAQIHIHPGSRRQSGWQSPLHLSHPERKRRSIEEQKNSRSISERTETKSSCSLARTILENLDNSEKKPLSHDNQHKKKQEKLEIQNLSSNLKRSLPSVVSPSNHIASPQDYISKEALITNSRVDNFTISGSYTKSSIPTKKLNQSLTPLSLSYPKNTSNMVTASTSSSQTPVISDYFSVFHSLKKGKSALIPNSNVVASSTQTSSHQKTLTSANESSNLDDETIKDITQGLDSFVSSVGWTQGKISNPVTKASISGVDQIEDEQAFTPSINFENLMNKRPKVIGGINIRTEKPEGLGITSNKVAHGRHCGPKTMFFKVNKSCKTILTHIRKHNKENTSEEARR